MRRAALLALVLCGALVPSAAAHEGNPNFESLVTAVDGVPGLKAEVLNGDDRLLLINEGDKTVIVEGYDGEPYARLRGDGVVEVNRRSPARTSTRTASAQTRSRRSPTRRPSRRGQVGRGRPLRVPRPPRSTG